MEEGKDITPAQAETIRVLAETVNKGLHAFKDELIDGVKASTQPAAPAQQPDEVEKLKTELDETKGKLQSWEKGEQFLAYTRGLHDQHPNSKPQFDEHMNEIIENLPKERVKELAEKQGWYPPRDIKIDFPPGYKPKIVKE